MAWQIKDEWIDMAQSRHYVIYHNPDILVEMKPGVKAPLEHHLIHEFKMDSCPHCGQIKVRQNATRKKVVEGQETDEDELLPDIDFHQIKADTLQQLNEHHSKVSTYRGQHPKARLGSGPKQ